MNLLSCPDGAGGIAECGADLSAFPSEKQFTSWLGLVPTNEQSGGKILNWRTRKVVNGATTALVTQEILAQKAAVIRPGS